MPLYDLMTGQRVTAVPYAAEYERYIARLASGELEAIKTKLNSMIDGIEIHTAGWMPGADWRGTEFQPIYEKCARHNTDLAARCFGLIVWNVFMDRPEPWVSGRFENHGEPIGSRTYFIDKTR